jgi:diaminohydroxyphosphoribosylaminopyrimidine deaminase/5-amino-6-(5-phosphoribosylamino)uracil reductase
MAKNLSKTSSVKTDERFMRRALALAEEGRGQTSPNPMVGAVLVRGGKILGEGFHAKAGEAHAEVNAVADARKRGHRIEGSTLYVTLEPCCTQGRTPACTDLILREKIKRVVVAATDPNPAHAGHGYTILRKAGVRVTTGICKAEAMEQNRIFRHWITTGTPWIIGKIALSLDGKITPPEPHDPWLTGPETRQVGHELRWEVDAILAGAETIRKDDPQLTVRLPGRSGKIQPWRIILTKSGKLPATAKVFSDEWEKRTIVLKKIQWKCLPKLLAERGITSALIEGGGEILGAAMEAGIVQEVAFFLAPQILGTKTSALGRSRKINLDLGQVKWIQVGNDLIGRARVKSIDSRTFRRNVPT